MNKEKKVYSPRPRTLTPKTKKRGKEGQRNLAVQSAAAPAAPFLSIPNRIGMPRIREEEPAHGAKGTTTEPFDGGAFTIEVLAHAGKGDREGAAVSRAAARGSL